MDHPMKNVVDELLDSYAKCGGIKHIDGSSLPSKMAVASLSTFGGRSAQATGIAAIRRRSESVFTIGKSPPPVRMRWVGQRGFRRRLTAFAHRTPKLATGN